MLHISWLETKVFTLSHRECEQFRPYVLTNFHETWGRNCPHSRWDRAYNYQLLLSAMLTVEIRDISVWLGMAGKRRPVFLVEHWFLADNRCTVIGSLDGNGNRHLRRRAALQRIRVCLNRFGRQSFWRFFFFFDDPSLVFSPIEWVSIGNKAVAGWKVTIFIEAGSSKFQFVIPTTGRFSNKQIPSASLKN